MTSQLVVSKILGKQPVTLQSSKESVRKFTEYLKKKFLSGAGINELSELRCCFVDNLLRKCADQLDLKEKIPDLALVAVGGYGRMELHPYTDIDILVVTRTPLSDDMGELVSSYITMLWDTTIDIGHSVRTVDECVSEGLGDITIATNLLEARFIYGSEETFLALAKKTCAPDFWPMKEFFRAKKKEQEERHRYYNDTVYLLEPDLKNNQGGLRDIQTIVWIAKKLDGSANLRDLAAKGYLTPTEYSELTTCEYFLFRTRFALQLSIAKNDNRLLFDRQKKVAEILGYVGEGNRPVEQFMNRFFQVVRRVDEITGVIMEILEERIEGPGPYGKITVIDDDFIIRGSRIDVERPEVFAERPVRMLEMFLDIAQRPEIDGIYHSCVRALDSARRQIYGYLNENEDCRRVFLKILSNPDSLRFALPQMHVHGVLSKYFQQWEKIVGQMQFDMFHFYTVDEHTVMALQNIWYFTHDDGKKREFVLFNNIYHSLQKPMLLTIATLLHDIAKGRGGHHAVLGEGEALSFCRLHGLDEYDCRFVAWLVRNHLEFSQTALRRDISSEEIVQDFAATVGDEEHLKALYCLTVVDICATNNHEWNEWKVSLFRELYYSTQMALRQGVGHPIYRELQIAENQRYALESLTNTGYEESRVRMLWATFTDDYFCKNSRSQISYHTRCILEYDRSSDAPLIRLGQPVHGGVELFVFCRDKKGLFAIVTRILCSKNADIVEAEIMNTTDGWALDTFVLREDEGDQYIQNRAPSIISSVEKGLTDPNFKMPVIKPIPKKYLEFHIPTVITFLKRFKENQTRVQISALDRPGLLSTIAYAFQELGINIVGAKISTTGERADDTFTINDSMGKCLSEEKEKELSGLLQERLKIE